ncbi:MAG TPA: DUF1028 domain-containing protein [Actinomycetota bacterium]|nr:DUF1028 domain-containing protein [Actinomycetota bacterium]
MAADPGAGEVGVAVQSRFLAVGAPWARGGVGAVATQALADVSLGPRGLDVLAEGVEPADALERLLASDPQRDTRQVGLIDARGRAASFTGADCFELASSVVGEGFACQGNIIATDRVVPAMAEAFGTATGSLAERMLEALRVAQREGGDRRGQESAAILVAKPGGGYGGNHDRYIDLRVDHHREPIAELTRLFDLHRLYLQRPSEEDVMDASPALEAEIGDHLHMLGKRAADQDVWDALFDYMAWENLEERWVGRGQVDSRVLEYLRRHAQRKGGP